MWLLLVWSAAPTWGLQPRDLVRLAKRAEKNHRRPLSDELETAQHEHPFDREGVRLGELLGLLGELRQAAKRKAATEMLEELSAGLKLALLPSEADRQCLERFVEFVKQWETKGEGRQLRDLIEYLSYFDEAGGEIFLQQEQAAAAAGMIR